MYHKAFIKRTHKTLMVTVTSDVTEKSAKSEGIDLVRGKASHADTCGRVASGSAETKASGCVVDSAKKSAGKEGNNVNRLVKASKGYAQKIEVMIPQKRAKLEKDLDIDLEEIMYYQQQKSLAQMRGLISTDEAFTIYNALNSWNTTTLAIKAVVIVGLGEMIKVMKKEG